MADDVQRIEEENNSLREEIEQVQQDRRAGFAKAEELSRSVTVQEENERLKEVLASQKGILEREEAARDSTRDGTASPVAIEGLATPDTLYTYTSDGPIVSDETNTADDERDERDERDDDMNEEN